MSEIMSCDTFVAMGSSTKSGKNIFAKNSDRPLSEAQPFIYFPERKRNDNKKLKCTYIEIDDVQKTNALYGSKPFWMWGFEHGINEHGVAIGNEAAWSKDKPEMIPGLLGMDLLRLALERGRTAYEAMHVIIDLLVQHGQGGNASTLREMRYHNLFILVDKTEGWVLETVNRRWVAKKIRDAVAISNCYSIEEDWDESCDDLKEYAYAMKWADPREKFNFAMAYGAIDDKHRNAHARKMRADKLLNQNKGNITTETMKKIMRDHFEGELIEPRWSSAHGLNTTICMHSQSESGSKTAAAMIVEFRTGNYVSCQHCFSTPCTSIFKPFYLTGKLSHNSETALGWYSKESTWWLYERLSLAVESNYNKHMKVLKEEQDKIEKQFGEEARVVEQLAGKRVKDGDFKGAYSIVDKFIEDCEKKSDEIAKKLYIKFEKDNKNSPIDLNRNDIICFEKKLVNMQEDVCQ